MSTSTSSSRSSAPSRSSSSKSSAPSRSSAPTRTSQASTARNATSTAPKTSPSTPKPTTTPVTDRAPATTTTTTKPSTDAATNRVQNGASSQGKQTQLQTGKDGFEQFQDNTKDKATVADHASRVADGFAGAFADEAQPQGGGCPNGQCGGGGGAQAGGDEGGGGGGGGGFLDKLVQLGQVAVDITKTAIEAGQNGAQQGMDAAQQGLDKAKELGGQGVDKLNQMINQAGTRFNLNDEEKAKLTEAMGTLKKLSGEDGRWNEKDIADNIAQMRLGAFARPIAEVQLRKGVEEMTGKPVDKLSQEQRNAAMEKWNKLSPEEQQRQAVSRGDMKQFQGAMDMVKERAQALGLPDSKMPNGMSVGFLQGIINNDPGALLMFKR